jgi:hypothetical protein
MHCKNRGRTVNARASSNEVSSKHGQIGRRVVPGYLIDTLGHLLATGYQTGRVFIAIPIALAEVAFPLWLLIKGVNPQQWQKRVPESGLGIEGAEA